MSSREIKESIKRIEDDLYFSSDNIKIRLTRIEEKLEHVATREDRKSQSHNARRYGEVQRHDARRYGSIAIGHGAVEIGIYRPFEYTISMVYWDLCIGLGVILTVLKLT